MNRPLPRPATDRHIKIYDEDWAFLSYHFAAPGGLVPKGVAVVVRELIHREVLRIRIKMNQEAAE